MQPILQIFKTTTKKVFPYLIKNYLLISSLFEKLPSQRRVFPDAQETILRLLSRPAPSGPEFYHELLQTGRV